jgi:hypothetical protein
LVLGVVLLSPWVPLQEATAAGGARAQPPAAHPHHHRRDHPPFPGRGFYGYGTWGPEIGVSIAPDTEHWRSNYVPDDYRLNGYDGRANHWPHICRGQTGMMLSTAGQRCPPGQHPAQGGRTLSTGG